MKAVLKFILKGSLIALWMVVCYYFCNKPEGFDYFLYWIFCGFPFGFRKMSLWFMPKGLGLAGTVGMWALRAVLGGMIGGVILMFTVLKMPADLVRELQNK